MHPAKNNLEIASNFQAEAHVQIILGKPVTSLAKEMRKMALRSVTFSLPTHLTPARWNVHLSMLCNLWNNGGCTTDQNRTELKRVLDENPRLRGGF